MKSTPNFENMETFLQQYGLFAALIGGFYQGEALYLAAMLTVSMGYLDPFSVAGAFFGGSITRDWLTFYFARSKGEEWVNKTEKRRARTAVFRERMERYPITILLSYRFIYGLKMFIIIAAGLSRISGTKFAALSLVSNAAWITTFGALGYFCASEVLAATMKFGQYSGEIIAVTLIGVAGFFMVRKLINRSTNKEELAIVTRENNLQEEVFWEMEIAHNQPCF